MLHPTTTTQSGLVLGVCCDQLMQHQQARPGILTMLAKKEMHMMMSKDMAMQEQSEKRLLTTTRSWFRCWPPPCFILFVSLLEVAVFVYASGETSMEDSMLIYSPEQRLQLWRFISYALLHCSWLHLGFNVLTQLLFGLPLELVHGSWRTCIIYLAGILAGSLGTSVVDSEVYLVGASGGVYALLAAQLASVALNFGQIRHGLAQLMAVLIFASCDLGYAVYSRTLEDRSRPTVSYIAHMTGALAGLSLGLLFLKQFQGGGRPRLLRWLALGVWSAFSIFAITFNLINTVTAQLLAEQEGKVIKQRLLHDLGME
ncbi:protein rhomboid [Drosophila tropicalis]|uniref:protein rhomboid n=1 Tax=Drosophila tropicalis TaxID=46794 RepID=UPI0035ABF57E